MSFNRGGRSNDRDRAQPPKTLQQEWQAFLEELGSRKQKPLIYDTLKESSLGPLTKESIDLYFPDEEQRMVAKRRVQNIKAVLPNFFKRNRVDCKIAPPPEMTKPNLPSGLSKQKATEKTGQVREVHESSIKSPLQLLLRTDFGEDRGNELAQPVLLAAAQADDTCEVLYKQLTSRTKALASETLTVRFPWRLRVGGMRGFRELLLPAMHPVYGVPYIPSSSLKGATLAWARRNGQAVNAERLFGTLEGGLGCVQLLDAFPSGPCLSVDMANPQWSWQDNQVKYGPAPHPLLTMREPELVIGLSCTSRGQQQDVEIVKAWLDKALQEGLGSRVSAGYGKTGLTSSLSHSRAYEFKLWSQGMYGAFPPTREEREGSLEFRPVALRGVLRYWFRAVALGLYPAEQCQKLENELFGKLSQGGKLRIGMEWQESDGDRPFTCTGKIQLEAASQECLELIDKVLELASLLGGVGRGSRRPLHWNSGRMRGCHWEITGKTLPDTKEAWQESLQQLKQAFLRVQEPTGNPDKGDPGEAKKTRRCQDVLNKKANIYILASPTLKHSKDVRNWGAEGDKPAVRGSALELLYSSEHFKGKNREGKGNEKVGGTLEVPSFVLIKSNYPASGTPYQTVTIFGADHEDRAKFGKALLEEGAIQVWPLSSAKVVRTSMLDRLTFEQYLEFDDDTDNRYELVDGKLFMTALPIGLHSGIIEFLQDTFKTEIKRLNLPWTARRDVGVRTGVSSSRNPDLCIMTTSQLSAIMYVSAVLQTPPLLAVEVVSPSTETVDYRYKQAEYATLGIQEYWIVDFMKARVSILKWEEGLYETTTYSGDDKIISRLLPELDLRVTQVLQVGSA